MFDRINEGRWWDFGWQLVEGCTPVSPACANCWSMAKEKRFRKETGIVFHEERINKPLQRKKPASYAIWNDIFHKEVPFEFIWKVFDMMFTNSRHTFLILTKRPERALEFFNKIEAVTRQEYEWGEQMMELDGDSDPICQPGQWPLKNVWIGTTCEDQERADKRIPILLDIPAAKRFVSIEPMLGPVDLTDIDAEIAGHDEFIHINTLTGRHTDMGRLCEPVNTIDWILCGSESGPERRPMNIEWVRDLKNQCVHANVPFFFKQRHEGNKKISMPELDGRIWDQIPTR